MDRFLTKAKSKLQKVFDDHDHDIPHAPLAPQQHSWTIQPPTADDILRYRFHHGANLGSIFVLERWLCWWMFPDGAAGESSLSAAKAWVERVGEAEAVKKFREHEENAISDEEIRWLAEEAGCTTVRLPIGYFDLDPSLLPSTPFDPYTPIFSHSWSRIRHLITRLHAHSIATLLDLHALPGGANKEPHSGTDTRTAALWTSKANRKLGVQCAAFLAHEVRNGLPGVAGIQLCNEADWDSPDMYAWYDECLAAVSGIDASIPVVISDGWDLGRAVAWSMSKNRIETLGGRPMCPVIVDTHCYWAFTAADKAKSSSQITSEVSTKLGELDGKVGDVASRGAAQVLVGEYSCALNPSSYEKSEQETGRGKEDLVRDFGHAQTAHWGRRTGCGGSFFWAWLKDANMHGEWNFSAMTRLHAIASPFALQNSLQQDRIAQLAQKVIEKREQVKHAAVAQHVAYWNSAAPEMGGEHWRYERGFDVGYSDGLAFLTGIAGEGGVKGGSRVGSVEVWVLKRVRESGLGGNFVWIFEHGVRRGIADVNAVVAGES